MLKWIQVTYHRLTNPYLRWFWKLPWWIKAPVTWNVHGQIADVFLMLPIYFVLRLFVPEWLAVVLGAGVGVGFYVYKEIITEHAGDVSHDKLKKADSIGDIMGPVVYTQLLAVWLLS